jgi:hypothetical protein
MDLLASSFVFALLQYYAESHALIYIVDSSDRDRIPDSKEAFGMHFYLILLYAFLHRDLFFQLVIHAKILLVKIFLTAVTFGVAADFFLPYFLKSVFIVWRTISLDLK